MQILDFLKYCAIQFYIILEDFKKYSRQHRDIEVVQNEDIQWSQR